MGTLKPDNTDPIPNGYWERIKQKDDEIERLKKRVSEMLGFIEKMKLKTDKEKELLLKMKKF